MPRTITIPQTPASPGIRIRFHYWFGTAFQSLGLRYHTLPGDDPFRYDRSDYQPNRLNANVQIHAAPGRNVKAMVFCEIVIGRYGYGGLSFCYAGDVFSRLVGERYALRRALDRIDTASTATGLGLTDVQRQKVWKEWLESYKATTKEWTALMWTPQATASTAGTATGRLEAGKPAAQDVPRKPEEIIRLLELLAAFTGSPL